MQQQHAETNTGVDVHFSHSAVLRAAYAPCVGGALNTTGRTTRTWILAACVTVAGVTLVMSGVAPPAATVFGTVVAAITGVTAVTGCVATIVCPACAACCNSQRARMYLEHPCIKPS